MDRATRLGVASLRLEHDLGALLCGVVHQDAADCNDYQHPRVYDRDDDDHSSCSEDALNGDDAQDWHDEVENDQVFGETSQDASDWIRVEKDDVGAKQTFGHRVVKVSGTLQNNLEESQRPNKGEDDVDADHYTENDRVEGLLLFGKFTT